MRWRDALLLAMRSLRRRRGRAVLTVVAVALASGLLVALASIAQTADSRIIGQLGKGGPATAITVAAAQPDPFSAGSDSVKNGKAKDIDGAVLQQISGLSSVSAVIPVLSASVMVAPLAPLPEGIPGPSPRATPTATAPGPPGATGAPSPSADPLCSTSSAPARVCPGVTDLPAPFAEHVVGVDIGRIKDLPVTLLAGRLPAADTASEVAVTQGYMDRIHVPAGNLTAMLGTQLEMAEPQIQVSGAPVHVRARRIRAVIVGVVAQQVSDGQLLAPISLTQAARAWALGGVDDRNFPLPTTEYTGLLVVASDLEALHGVRQGITELGYATSAPEHLVASVQKYLHVVDIVLGAIGSVSLVIAALGIADALLAAVRERRQEIATLKAIGATDGDVVRWFLIEALVVGALGGVAGTVVGLAVAFGVGVTVNQYLVQQGIEGINFGGIPGIIVAGGVLGSVVLAVIAGALPAFRAARLPAYEALGGGA